MRHNLHTIKKVLTSRKGLLIFLLATLSFAGLNYYLNELYVIGITYILYLPKAIHLPFLIFTMLNSLLVGVSAALAVHRISQLRANGLISGGGISLIGSFFGLLSGACPACIAGFFPVVMGAIGHSNLALMGLPLYGLELQIASSILLLVGIYYLSKPLVCRV